MIRNAIYLTILASMSMAILVYQNCSSSLNFQTIDKSVFDQIISESNGGGYTGINPYVGRIYATQNVCNNAEAFAKIKFFGPGEAYLVQDNCMFLANPIRLTSSDFHFSSDFKVLMFRDTNFNLEDIPTTSTAQFVQAKQFIPSGNPTEVIALSLNSAFAAGNLAVCALTYKTTVGGVVMTLSGVSDSLGNSYKRAAGTGAVGSSAAAVWYAENTKAGSATVNPNITNLQAIETIQCAEYSGIAITNALDQTATAPSSATLSINTNANNELLVLVGLGIQSVGASDFVNSLTVRPTSVGTILDRSVFASGTYGGLVTAIGPIILLSFRAR